jgi:hypothetical protein
MKKGKIKKKKKICNTLTMSYSVVSVKFLNHLGDFGSLKALDVSAASTPFA